MQRQLHVYVHLICLASDLFTDTFSKITYPIHMNTCLSLFLRVSFWLLNLLVICFCLDI